MIVNVELHLRPDPLADHRSLGMVAIDLPGASLAPHRELACWLGGRRVRAEITSIHQRGGHLPRVYADSLAADELVP